MEAGLKSKLKKVLKRTLNNLGQDEFKEFKHRLRDINQQHQQDEKQIPWITLKDADPVTALDLIMAAYDADSGDIVVSVLRDISQNNWAKTLQNELEGVFPDRGAKDGKTTTAGSEKGKEDVQKGSVAGNEGNAATADSDMEEDEFDDLK